MKPLADKIKYQFTQTELKNLSELLYEATILKSFTFDYDNKHKCLAYMAAINLTKLFKRVRTKIEDTPASQPTIKFSLKTPEYLAFYTAFNFNQGNNYNTMQRMLINKILTEIDQKL